MESMLLENKVQGQSSERTIPSLKWKDSLPTKQLLDVICSILAEEYIMIAKQNPGVFTEVASRKIGTVPCGDSPYFPHNDGR